MTIFMQIWCHVLYAIFNLMFLMIFLFKMKPGWGGRRGGL